MLEYVIIPFVASLFSMLLLFWQDMIRFISRSRVGATIRRPQAARSSSISIHAPVRERRSSLSCMRRISHFNSRSREGATIRRRTEARGMR